jgi:hypothetical protein
MPGIAGRGEKMKHIKIMGLAIVAALAVMAMAGAASASAATTVCSTNTAPCTGTTYGSGTKIASQLKAGADATLTTNIGNVTCLKSTVAGSLTNSEGHGEISSLTFTECSLGSTPCTVKSVNTPYTAQATATSGGNGTLTVNAKSGGGNPGASVECGFLINCTFSSTDLVLDVQGGTTPLIKAISEPLSRSGGFCPETSNWDAEYEITTPKPLFLTTP